MKQVYKTIRTNCHMKIFLISWVSKLLINILNLTYFASILTYICMYGSGSGSVLDQYSGAPWFRIHIRNTDIQHWLLQFLKP